MRKDRHRKRKQEQARQAQKAFITIASLVITAFIWSALIYIYYSTLAKSEDFRGHLVEQIQLILLLMVSLLSIIVAWMTYKLLKNENPPTALPIADMSEIANLFSILPEDVQKIQEMPVANLDTKEMPDDYGNLYHVTIIRKEPDDPDIQIKPPACSSTRSEIERIPKGGKMRKWTK